MPKDPLSISPYRPPPKVAGLTLPPTSETKQSWIESLTDLFNAIFHPNRPGKHYRAPPRNVFAGGDASHFTALSTSKKDEDIGGSKCNAIIVLLQPIAEYLEIRQPSLAGNEPILDSIEFYTTFCPSRLQKISLYFDRFFHIGHYDAAVQKIMAVLELQTYEQAEQVLMDLITGYAELLRDAEQ